MAEATSDTLEAADIPVVNDKFRLQFEKAQDSWVLLYPEGMVKLSQSAAEILKRCDGNATIDAIVGSLENAFGEQNLSDDVMGFMAIALEQKWIQRAVDA